MAPAVKQDARRRPDNSYSRMIGWLKIVLPLLALGILSTLFLLSEPRNPQDNLPYTEAELDELVTGQQIRSPAYSGVTDDGSAVTIAAERAAPGDSGGTSRAEALIGSVEMPGGGRIDLSAAEGRIDESAREARLEGRVAIRSSTGYRVETEALTAQLDRTELVSDGTITAKGPPGRIEAGRMELTGRDGRFLLSFSGGVKLIYQPPSKGGSAE